MPKTAIATNLIGCLTCRHKFPMRRAESTSAVTWRGKCPKCGKTSELAYAKL